MTKRKIWITVAICVAVALLIGLAIGGMRLWRSGEADDPAGTTAPASTEANGDSTTGETGEPDTTEPDSTDPTASAEAVPEPTEAVTDPGAAESTAPATPGGAAAATPDPTAPEPTDPPATKPAATEATAKPTTAKPAATEATKHTHKYSKKVVKPTCTKKGYTKYTCSCGDTYKDDYVAATGHDYKSKKVNPTCEDKGYTKYTCSTCGDSYKDNYVAASEKYHAYVYVYTTEPSLWSEGYDKYVCPICYKEKYENVVDALVTEEEYCRMCAEATVKWINYYRKQQGDTEAEILPGLTLVAEYRANQLTTNFAHSTRDLREAYAYYDYGEWVDGSKWGIDSYYTANAKEAIGTGVYRAGEPDDVGRDAAEMFLRSSGHWDYVGDSEWCYIGVGIKGSKICILLTQNNYG